MILPISLFFALLMFFFRGSSSTLIKSEVSYHTVCPVCGKKGSVRFHAYGKYEHFMFIPLYPKGRDLVARCEKCSHTWDYSEMSQDQKKEIFAFSNKYRRPVVHYTGVTIILLFFAFLFYVMYSSDSRRDRYLANPQVNDLYEVKIDTSGYYTIMRIEEIKDDSIYFSANKYAVGKSSLLEEIKPDKNYNTSKLIPIATKDVQLRIMMDGVSFYTISRPGKNDHDKNE